MLFHHWSEKFANDSSANIGLNGYRIEAIFVIPIAFLIFLFVALVYDARAVIATATAVMALTPVWVPLFLATTFWTIWIDYIRFQFLFSQKMVLLEIQLPPEVQKSPLAMELFLTSLWNSVGETTFISRIWKGQFRPIWSLEIASNEGRVSFYLYINTQWRNTTEARLYGQFPEAKIMEVEDYTRAFDFNLDEYELFGTEYEKIGGKTQALPIKTYIDYQLDKNPDTPEIQVDPLTHLLELFGSIGEGQYLWMQIIIKARKKDEWYGFYKYTTDSWKDPAKQEIKKIMAGAAKRAQEVLKESEIVEGKMNALLSDGEKKQIEAIEHSLGKLVFECGFRALHIAKKDKFVGANNVGLVRLFDPFRTSDNNALNVNRGLAIYDYPWQDFHNIRKNKIKRQLFFFYRERAYFYVPYDQVPVFMTPEELASLWHFPNSLTQPPGLGRVTSKRSEAPANLPTLPT